MPPLVPGFTITSELSLNATGSWWVGLRSLDGRRFVLRIIPVADVSEAQLRATQLMVVCDRIENEHLVRQHGAIALADGTLALVLDEVTGGSLAQLIGVRGQLTAGETVTTLAPLFRTLADLHAARMVHGDLTPGNIVFSADGRPLIGDLGLASLLKPDAGPFDKTSGFVAPEIIGGAAVSPASDVYAMAALGWFCLTGAPPGPAATRASLAMLSPQAPSMLVSVLTSALATDPQERPCGGAAAVEVFDAAPAESVALAPISDPAAEITRRIRAAAVSVCPPAPSGNGKTYRTPMIIGVVAVLVAVVFGVGVTWFLRHQSASALPVAPRQVAVPSATHPRPALTARPARTPVAMSTSPAPISTSGQSTRRARSSNEVLTASGSPRVAAAGVLQALVDARALAYLARDSGLLVLVYAPGATQADADRVNIATALANGGTYLGLTYLVQDVAFLDGTSGTSGASGRYDTARIRATIVTPAYRTGQPDGGRIAHAQEVLGPCVFSLSLTPDGWRILGLSAPGSS